MASLLMFHVSSIYIYYWSIYSFKQAPIDAADTQHTENKNTHLRSALRLSKHLITDNPHSIDTNPKFKVNQGDHINSPKSISSHNSKSLAHPKSKNKTVIASLYYSICTQFVSEFVKKFKNYVNL